MSTRPHLFMAFSLLCPALAMAQETPEAPAAPAEAPSVGEIPSVEAPPADAEPVPVEPAPVEPTPASAAPVETAETMGTDEAELVDEGADEPAEVLDFEASPEGEGEDDDDTEVMVILGDAEEMARLAGSAHAVDEEALETYEYDDVHRVLDRVPGAYVRDEEGFGLRPNIGIRGVNPERSSKITLMEDGVLLAPAPYAAPAAYYFPQTTRMTRVEVFKGPAAVQYGPYTVGGAINFVTRAVPREGHLAEIDLGYGQTNFGKAHGWYGWGGKHMGVLVEGVRLQSDGFKDLDGGGDTGFEKNEAMVKLRFNSTPGAEIFHRVELKLGYSDEVSNETYLGLTPDDFERTPYRRYAASQRDRMDWERTQVVLNYLLQVGEPFEVRLTAYRHDFDRTWRRLDRFNGADLRSVLNNPDSGANAVLYGVLTGQEDATGQGDTLEMLNNTRSFFSQGVQMVGEWALPGETVSQKLDFGARFHMDQIKRNHTLDGFLMQGGRLVPDGTDREDDTLNTGEAQAWAFHAMDTITVGDSLFFTPGARVEIIETDFEDRLNPEAEGRVLNRTDTVFIPGLGVYWQMLDQVGVLAGVHKGFSAVPPGQPDTVSPESSVNYEAGLRSTWKNGRAEAIGYFNDYGNLTAQCTLSLGDCGGAGVGDQFDGGEVHVYGVETTLAHGVSLGGGLQLDFDLNYTLTLSEFQTDFLSGNSQFGQVTTGDALPYLPEHQGALIVGLTTPYAGLSATTRYTSAARDVAGQGDIPELEEIPARTVVDLAAYWQIYSSGRLYGRIDNVLNNDYIASRRPFGIRPGKPFLAMVGFKQAFGDD